MPNIAFPYPVLGDLLTAPGIRDSPSVLTFVTRQRFPVALVFLPPRKGSVSESLSRPVVFDVNMLEAPIAATFVPVVFVGLKSPGYPNVITDL